MSNNKYQFKGTKGEWKVAPLKGYGANIENEDGEQVCIIEDFGEEFGEATISDAYLLAAAPDLLDFAVMMLQSIDGGGQVVTVQDHHIDELRAAIHKALNIQ